MYLDAFVLVMPSLIGPTNIPPWEAFKMKVPTIYSKSTGIKDVLAKSKGSSNPHNVVKATFDGLIRLRDPLAIAKQRGVSLKKVFNG